MPTNVIDIKQAFSNLRTNEHAAWGKGKTSAEPGSDPNCASARLHKDNLQIGVRPSERKLAPGSSIFAMGSCFAREIEAALSSQGFQIVSRPKEDRQVSGYRHEGRSESELLNRYNTASMFLEFQRILENREVIPDDALLISHVDGNFLEAHYHSIGSATPQEIAERRLRFWEDFQEIRSCDAIFITLGVNEAPYDPRVGLYRNVSPLVREMRQHVPIEVHVLSVDDNVAYLEQIWRLLRSNIPTNPLIFLTVSPVPLTSTYTQDDVIVANAHSKATLRAAAAEFCARHPDVIYFPSYEIATGANPTSVFAGDKRHIQKSFVAKIIGQFVGAYVEPGEGTQDEGLAPQPVLASEVDA